uniref:Uncharacterized protein n=1 Tax=Solanum tuberosum TaxID=4113 RepID=M1CNF4_SOLTU
MTASTGCRITFHPGCPAKIWVRLLSYTINFLILGETKKKIIITTSNFCNNYSNSKILIFKRENKEDRDEKTKKIEMT